MSYIFTDDNNVIFEISETLDYQSNGNYLVKEGTLAIPPSLVNGMYEVEIPEEVSIQKYCYTEEQGFYKNVNYREYFSEEDRISALEDTVNMLLGF